MLPTSTTQVTSNPGPAHTRHGVFRGGCGEPLVLLHAGGATWRMWRPVLPALVAERDVLAPTLLGCLGGPALPVGEPLTVFAIADAIERELDAAGFERVDIVGNSLGGFAAFELARRGRARSLVAIGPMGMQTDAQAEQIVRALVGGHRVASALRPAVLPALALPSVRKKVLRTAFGVVHGERVRPDLARHLFHALTRCDVGAAFEAGPAGLQIRDAHEIATPTLIIHGDRDPVARRDQIDRYLDALPNARLVALADVGHCPQLELPERVAEEILRFTGTPTRRRRSAGSSRVPSRRSVLLAAGLARSVRPIAERSSPSGWQLRALRALTDGLGIAERPRSLLEKSARSGQARGVWVCGRGVDRSDRALLYLHGGGFVFGSPRAYRSLAERLSAASGMRVFLADYRRAPEHPFPAAADDALAAYHRLLEEGYSASRIALAGDSVGALLVSSVIGDLLGAELPVPAAALLISPALDARGEGVLAHDRLLRDPVMPPVYGLKCRQAYLGPVSPDHPRVAVLDTPKSGWPPVLIQIGGTECLLTDARRMAHSLTASAVPCELQIWPGQVHVFHAFAGWLPEARDAIRAAGDWLCAHASTDSSKETPDA